MRAGQVKGLTDDDLELLTVWVFRRMTQVCMDRPEVVTLGGKEAMKKWDDGLVWKMLMGVDILEGEGVVL